MNRNVNSRFALAPADLNISRSQFDRSCSHKLTFNVGDVIPFYVDEVLPGDTFNVKTSKVVRLPALLKPMMDNLYLDTYYFYVPNRIVWDHWKEFLGEPADNAWLPNVDYQIPQLYGAPAESEEEQTYRWYTGSVADYMGIPVGVPGIRFSALPFRAYAKICNEWFRDENLSDPLVINTGDADTPVITDETVWTYSDLELPALGLTPYKASKFRDYFSAALVSPQRGPDVALPFSGNAPVFASDDLSADFSYEAASDLRWKYLNYNDVPTGPLGIFRRNVSDTEQEAYTVANQSQTVSNQAQRVTPDNLIAYMADSSLVTVNQLRIAFQLQKFYERSARGGARYTELLKSFFGVSAPDASLQRPEYLGGNRIPVTINQIIQQSMSSGDNPLGEVAAMSLTTDTHGDFIKSFVEHGYVIGVMVARYDHTYQQGLERMWSRRDKFDFYFPVFANLGEQPILNKEIYAQGTDADDEVFGYQEAWADYRYKPNRVSGLMRSDPYIPSGNVPGSLDIWHLADDYDSLPHLSDQWIKEDAETVNRVLSVGSETSGLQLFADVYIHNRCTRPMPLYSIPGLIDHH